MESPKSVALSSACSVLSARRKFSGFKSRCTTPSEWQRSSTLAMVRATAEASRSLGGGREGREGLGGRRRKGRRWEERRGRKARGEKVTGDKWR